MQPIRRQSGTRDRLSGATINTSHISFLSSYCLYFIHAGFNAMKRVVNAFET
jgi:hypothetical protein